MIRRGICDRVDAFDGSETSLAAAREAAVAEGVVDRIAYRNDDFDRVTLPRRAYDVVFFHQSLHHVSRLERLLRQVARTLRPGGLLYLEEYVGPSRTYWTDRTVAWYRALFRMIPEHVRYQDELLLPVQWDDWSEAVRSGESRPRRSGALRRGAESAPHSPRAARTARQAARGAGRRRVPAVTRSRYFTTYRSSATHCESFDARRSVPPSCRRRSRRRDGSPRPTGTVDVRHEADDVALADLRAVQGDEVAEARAVGVAIFANSMCTSASEHRYARTRRWRRKRSTRVRNAFVRYAAAAASRHPGIVEV